MPFKEWIRFCFEPASDDIKAEVAQRFPENFHYLFGDDNPNIFKTVKGWWWNDKLQKGFLDRPIAKDVSIAHREMELDALSKCIDILHYRLYKPMGVRHGF